MGNYSYYGYSELFVPDIELFNKWLIAKIVEVGDVKNLGYLYRAIKTIGNKYNGELAECEVFLDINGWKIWGYWYQDFKQLLADIWLQGVRGKINMEEEQGYEFEIYFNEDGVTLKDIGRWSYYAVDSEGCETDIELDEPILIESIDKTYPLVDENGNVQS